MAMCMANLHNRARRQSFIIIFALYFTKETPFSLAFTEPYFTHNLQMLLSSVYDYMSMETVNIIRSAKFQLFISVNNIMSTTDVF